MASVTFGSTSLLRPFAPPLAPLRRPCAASARAASYRTSSLCIRAAKLPSGVELPKEEPKLPTALWGFTVNAERWNARAAMQGSLSLIMCKLQGDSHLPLIRPVCEFLFLVSQIIQKGILQVIGFEVGKGLNLPL